MPIWPPSIVPTHHEVYLLLDDFGMRYGRVWREAAEEDTSREAVIRILLQGEYSHPVLIVAFNTAEGWSRNVTAEIAEELRRRIDNWNDLAPSVREFLEANRWLM